MIESSASIVPPSSKVLVSWNLLGKRISDGKFTTRRRTSGKSFAIYSKKGESLVQRRQAETSHFFEHNIRFNATVVGLIGKMAIENLIAVEK
jgi:hypothetical protein